MCFAHRCIVFHKLTWYYHVSGFDTIVTKVYVRVNVCQAMT